MDRSFVICITWNQYDRTAALITQISSDDAAAPPKLPSSPHIECTHLADGRAAVVSGTSRQIPFESLYCRDDMETVIHKYCILKEGLTQVSRG